MAAFLHKRAHLVLSIALVALVFAIYCPSLGNSFIKMYDDDVYITDNPMVQRGLTWESVRWALTTSCQSNWHPLTWLSHMLDVRLYGMSSTGHHLTNMLIHALNTLLLFWLLRRMTGFTWRSAFIAALFAAHPLHVESVAWAAERKDVLSGMFWLLTMWLYAHYVDLPSPKRYVPVIVSFGLGLMAKPMLVTLPIVLLLMDYWPLGRFRRADGKPSPAKALILGKVPFFAMTVCSSLVTIWAQAKGGSVTALDALPVLVRFDNTLVSYVNYVSKAIWPTCLAVIYPHPGYHLPLWQILGSAALLCVLTVLLLRGGRRRPYLAVGWLWYVITLIPVIGMLQVGSQSMADRYMYLPIIGLLFIVAWGVPDLVGGLSKSAAKPTGTAGAQVVPGWLTAAALVIVLASSLGAQNQTRYWVDNRTLFQHALDCTTANYSAHNEMGLILADRGELDAAIDHYLRALEYNPGSSLIHTHYGAALALNGDLGGAVQEYNTALSLNPRCFQALANLAAALGAQGRMDEAIVHFERALELKPDDYTTHGNLAMAYFFSGRYADAWTEVHLCRRYGGEPNPKFVEDLNGKMSDPGG